MSEDIKRALLSAFRKSMEMAETAHKTGDTREACRMYLESAQTLTRISKYASGDELEQIKSLAKGIIEKAKSLSDVQEPEKSSSKKKMPAKSPVMENDPWFESDIPSTSFEDVAGLENVKTLVRERVIGPILNPGIYRQMKLAAGTGLMMFGPPGTGKTTIARAIAHEVNAPIAIVDCQKLINSLLGEGEKKVHELFECARKYETCVIFFDDFESIALKRGTSHDAIDRIISQLLVEMDGFKANKNNMLLLSATNIPWSIDPAFKRQNRFTQQVYISLPNEEARLQMLSMNIKGVNQAGDLDLRGYASITDGYSGGDMRTLTDSAKMNAIRRATLEHSEDAILRHSDFMDALQVVKPSVNGEQLMEYRKYILENNLPIPEEM